MMKRAGLYIASSIKTFGTEKALSNALLINFLKTLFQQQVFNPLHPVVAYL